MSLVVVSYTHGLLQGGVRHTIMMVMMSIATDAATAKRRKDNGDKEERRGCCVDAMQGFLYAFVWLLLLRRCLLPPPSAPSLLTGSPQE